MVKLQHKYILLIETSQLFTLVNDRTSPTSKGAQITQKDEATKSSSSFTQDGLLTYLNLYMRNLREGLPFDITILRYVSDSLFLK